MALALGYGVATFSGTDLGLDIATMVALHGSLNAFGFALLGLVGWRLALPSGYGGLATAPLSPVPTDSVPSARRRTAAPAPSV